MTERRIRYCIETIVSAAASYDGDLDGDIVAALRDEGLSANPLRALALEVAAIVWLGWAPDCLWGILRRYRDATGGAAAAGELGLYCDSSAHLYDAAGRDRLRACTSLIARAALGLLLVELKIG